MEQNKKDIVLESTANVQPSQPKADSEQSATNSCDLNEIRDLLLEQNRIGKRKSVFLLIAAIAIVGLCVFCIVVVSMLLPKIETTITNINAAVDSVNQVVQQLDIEDINTLIEDTASIAKEGVAVVENAKALLEDLNDIDFDALNSSIRGLDSTLDSISVINFETLNQAITDLQTTIAPFAEFMSLFKK